MAVKRIVSTSFWDDPYVVDNYSPEDKYCLLYLLTNPKTRQVGIYTLPRKIIAFEMGYTVDSIKVLLERFESKYKNIIYDETTQEIAILNSLKHSIIKGGKPLEDLIIKDLQAVESTNLIKAVYENMVAWWSKSKRATDKSIKNIFETELLNRNVNVNENENEKSYPNSYNESSDESGIESSNKKDDIPYKEIIDYLNEKASKGFKASTRKNQELIKARMNEGFNVEDFKKVIDNKVLTWKGDSKMDQYLRPVTLFGTKFESYLNENVAVGAKSKEEEIAEKYKDLDDIWTY